MGWGGRWRVLTPASAKRLVLFMEERVGHEVISRLTCIFVDVPMKPTRIKERRARGSMWYIRRGTFAEMLLLCPSLIHWPYTTHSHFANSSVSSFNLSVALRCRSVWPSRVRAWQMEHGVVVTKYGKKGAAAQRVLYLDGESRSVAWRELDASSPSHRRSTSLTNIIKGKREVLALAHLIEVGAICAVCSGVVGYMVRCSPVRCAFRPPSCPDLLSNA